MKRKIVLAAVVSVIAAYTAFWCDDGSDWDSIAVAVRINKVEQPGIVVTKFDRH